MRLSNFDPEDYRLPTFNSPRRRDEMHLRWLQMAFVDNMTGGEIARKEGVTRSAVLAVITRVKRADIWASCGIRGEDREKVEMAYRRRGSVLPSAESKKASG